MCPYLLLSFVDCMWCRGGHRHRHIHRGVGYLGRPLVKILHLKGHNRLRRMSKRDLPPKFSRLEKIVDRRVQLSSTGRVEKQHVSTAAYLNSLPLATTRWFNQTTLDPEWWAQSKLMWRERWKSTEVPVWPSTRKMCWLVLLLTQASGSQWCYGTNTCFSVLYGAS